jgi:hypothetical protein
VWPTGARKVLNSSLTARTRIGHRGSPDPGSRRGAKEAGTDRRREALLREVGVAGGAQGVKGAGEPDAPVGQADGERAGVAPYKEIKLAVVDHIGGPHTTYSVYKCEW